MAISSMYVPGIIDSVAFLNLSVFTDTCVIYPFLPEVSNGEGGTSTGFATAVHNIPCRLDDSLTNLLPQRAKDNIDVEKVERQIYIPRGTTVSGRDVDIEDELETTAGSPSGSLIRYRVLDTIIETDETDIGLLVEVVR